MDLTKFEAAKANQTSGTIIVERTGRLRLEQEGPPSSRRWKIIVENRPTVAFTTNDPKAVPGAMDFYDKNPVGASFKYIPGR